MVIILNFIGFRVKQCNCNFDDISKLSYSRPHLITVFWNKNYDVIIFVYGLTSKILSRDSNCIVDMTKAR